MPEFPKQITVKNNNLIIDGEAFPWWIAPAGLSVRRADNDMERAWVVNVPILVFTDETAIDFKVS